MQNVLRIISEIQATPKRTEKEAILEVNKDNKLFKDILYFIYNPYTVTGIAKKKLAKIEKKMHDFPLSSINTVDDMMAYLNTNNTGKDADVINVLSFINTQPQELQQLYKLITIKDLQCGMEAKTINKIYGKDFIPTFDLMLAEKFREWKEVIRGKRYIITIKLDGNRLALFVENGKATLRSRSGQPMDGYVEIEADAVNLPDGMMYDGEVRVPKPDWMDSKTAYALTSKITRTDGEKKGLYFHVFDAIPISDFNNGICKTPCEERKIWVRDTLAKLNLNKIIDHPMLYVGDDFNKIDELFKESLEKLEEGIMINIADASYQCKRVKDLLKDKAEETVDLRVVGFEEGKIAGTLGSFTVLWKGFPVGVGSGIPRKKEVASKMWEDRDSYMGKIIEITYTEESVDDMGNPSLRFPRFRKVREDKNEESYA